MLHTAMGFVRDIEARSIPPYQQFLRAQRIFIADRYKRFMGALGHESPGVRLLRYILSFVDYEYLEKQVNNYDRYMYHMRYIRKDLYNIFDRLQQGRGYKYLFFKKSAFYTEEFLMPVEDINAIVNLPLHTDEWEVWKHVKPLYLWYHSSPEFTVNIVNDTIRFSTLPPSYAVELLDVVALVFKYYIWLKQQRDKEEAEELALHAPQQLFLHKYVMSPLVWDLGDIWLIRMLNSILTVEDIEDLDDYSSSALQLESQYGRIASQSRQGFEYLWRLTHEIKRNLRPEALLSSRTLFSGSLHSRMRLVEAKLPLPIHRQYNYLRWLRDRDLLKLFVGIYKTRPDLTTTKRLLVNLRRDGLRLLRTSPWNICNSSILKREIQNEMETFVSSL